MVRTVGLTGYSDVHYTADSVARRIVAHFRPAGICLEPLRGPIIDTGFPYRTRAAISTLTGEAP